MAALKDLYSTGVLKLHRTQSQILKWKSSQAILRVCKRCTDAASDYWTNSVDGARACCCSPDELKRGCVRGFLNCYSGVKRFFQITIHIELRRALKKTPWYPLRFAMSMSFCTVLFAADQVNGEIAYRHWKYSDCLLMIVSFGTIIHCYLAASYVSCDPARKWAKFLWIQKGPGKAVAANLLMVYGVLVNEFINSSGVSRYLMLFFCLYVFSIAMATQFPTGFDATGLWLGSTMIMVWATDCGSCGGERHIIQATIVTIIIALLASLRVYLESYEDDTIAGPNDQPPGQNDQGATGSDSNQNNEDAVTIVIDIPGSTNASSSSSGQTDEYEDAVTSPRASSHAADDMVSNIPGTTNASSSSSGQTDEYEDAVTDSDPSPNYGS